MTYHNLIKNCRCTVCGLQVTPEYLGDEKREHTKYHNTFLKRKENYEKLNPGYTYVNFDTAKEIKKEKMKYIISLVRKNDPLLIEEIVKEANDALWYTYIYRNGWGRDSRIQYNSFEAFCAEDPIFWLEYNKSRDCLLTLPENEIKDIVYGRLKMCYDKSKIS